MLDLKDLRGMGVQELKAKVEGMKQTHSKEFVKTKVGSKTEKAVNLRNIRKDIARVLTIITEKENKSLGNEKKEVKTKKVEITKKKEVEIKESKEVKGKTETKKSKK